MGSWSVQETCHNGVMVCRRHAMIGEWSVRRHAIMGKDHRPCDSGQFWSYIYISVQFAFCTSLPA